MKFNFRKTRHYALNLLSAGVLVLLASCSSGQNLTGASDGSANTNAASDTADQDQSDNTKPPASETDSLADGPSGSGKAELATLAPAAPKLSLKSQGEELQLAEKSNALYQDYLQGVPVNLNPTKDENPKPELGGDESLQYYQNMKPVEKFGLHPNIPVGSAINKPTYFHVKQAYPGAGSSFAWSQIKLKNSYWMPSVYFDAPIDFKTCTPDTVKLYFAPGNGTIYLPLAPVLTDGTLLNDTWTSGDPNRLKYYVDYSGSLANPKDYINNKMTFLVVLKGGPNGVKDMNGDQLHGNVIEDGFIPEGFQKPLIEVGDYSWSFVVNN